MAQTEGPSAGKWIDEQTGRQVDKLIDTSRGKWTLMLAAL